MNDLVSAFGELLADIATRTSSQALNTDPRLRARLEELEGNSVEVNCQLPPVTWHFLITNGGLTLKYGPAEAPQVVISGNAADLSAWMVTGEAPGRVDIDGDESLLLELQEIFKQFEPDIEDPLGQFVGPQVASTLLGTAELGLKGLRSLVEGIGGAARNQQADYVSKEQLDNVLSGIDELRLRVDRLAERVNQAGDQVSSANPPQPPNPDDTDRGG